MTSLENPNFPLLRTSPMRAIVMLFIIAIGFMLIVSFLAKMMMPDPATTRFMRIFAVMQDLFVFILPPAIVAVICSTAPGKLLEIERKPSALWAIMAVLALLSATPTMNFIVEWNENLSLPESLAGLQDMMRAAEDSAKASIELLMGGTLVTDLIMSILIIGILAAVSEELFFRGALLGCMMQSRMSKHLAIWLTAVIFSLFHFQFFGFVPRILLGAFFGYLTVWSGSIWVSVIVHAINNSIIVVAEWLSRTGRMDFDINSAGTSSFTLILASVILTAGIIRISLKYLKKSNRDC